MSLRLILASGVALLLALSAGQGVAAPANDSPTSPEVLDGCYNTVTGTTAGSANDVWDINCLNVSYPDGQQVDPYGGDVFYQVTVPWSFDLYILAEPLGDWDVSVYVFTTPNNAAETCRVAADVAGPGVAEQLHIQNDSATGLPRDYIIGVDSWSMSSVGDFRLSVSCDIAVPTSRSSFSTLKSRFNGDH